MLTGIPHLRGAVPGDVCVRDGASRFRSLLACLFALLIGTALAAPRALAAPPAQALPLATPAAAAAPADTLDEYAQLQRIDAQIEAGLAGMRGVMPGSDSVIAWKVFDAHPRRTVELILPSLKPVEPGLHLGAPNMVWRVRVLQRLTGVKFRGRTRARFGDEARELLLPDSSGTVPFAGENAPRGITWVAPRDAQRSIVEQWRRWWGNASPGSTLPARSRAGEPKGWWW